MLDQLDLFAESTPAKPASPKAKATVVAEAPRPWPDRTPKGVEEYREIARIAMLGLQPSPTLARMYDDLADEIEAEIRRGDSRP